jgi:hypothetical protein
MNIFKVLASTPRSKFSENQTSAILAWLLNPYMDHGLGFEFLKIFLNGIGKEDIASTLQTRISGKKDNSGDVKVFLEYQAIDRYIDIV